jgi:hypothetical protein
MTATRTSGLELESWLPTQTGTQLSRMTLQLPMFASTSTMALFMNGSTMIALLAHMD